MKYNLEKLKSSYQNQEKMKYLFFWGHQPSKSGIIDKRCFSQWWPCTFQSESITYHSVEQYMMAEKAKLFGDNETRQKILACKHPKQAKDLGRQVKGFQEALWVENRFGIVKKANYEKFHQNQQLLTFLIETKERILVEASPVDKIWGVGLAADDARITNPEQWKGLNLLGFALMEVRDSLAKEFNQS